MTAESAGGSGADDQTLAAIYEVAKTMGGEGGAEVSVPPVTPTATHQSNQEAEKALIEAGILTKGGSVQRAVLGCMACKFGGEGQGEQGIKLSELSRCHDRDPHPIRRLLQRLVDTGVISSTGEVKRTTVSARERYGLGAAGEEIGLHNKLEKPEQCGLEGPKNTTNVAAEQALIDAGVIERKSTTRRIALGCLGCQIQKGEEGVYGFGVEQCQGVDHATVVKTFGQLVEGGALEAYTEDYRPGAGRPRVIYTPAYSPLGTQLRELLEAPDPAQCGLRNQQGKE